MLLNILFIALTEALFQPQIHPAVVPANFLYDAAMLSLGSPCESNVTCSGSIPNTQCKEKRCACLENFAEDPAFPGTCKLAPGFNEACNTAEPKCRAPFVCNSSEVCDCPSGYLQEYFQCIRDCPFGHIPIDNKCYPGRQLGEECEIGEQCMQSFSQCLHRKCQCISGANQFDGQCFPVNQCPLGEPMKDKRGAVMSCKEDEGRNCLDDHYCLYPQFNNDNGFCCPKIKMNCPIGKPLEGTNCSSCPWDTHHCFSYVIGSYTETMCCPNPCPATQPIQSNGQCFSRSAFGGHCMVEEQCFNVVGAVCRGDKDQKKCQCPEGNYINYFGKCIRESNLGQECSKDEECKAGSNTVCIKGVCTCFQGYMPEPVQGSDHSPSKCIAEPSCPTANGVQAVTGSYEDCSENEAVCKSGQFCRHWWYEGNRTYSLCCKQPRTEDYQAICQPFGMRLVMVGDKDPMVCDIAPSPQFYLHDALGNIALNAGEVRYCNTGASCIFDPFSVNMGVCCEAVPLVEKKSKVEAGEKKVVIPFPKHRVPIISLRPGGRKSDLDIDS